MNLVVVHDWASGAGGSGNVANLNAVCVAKRGIPVRFVTGVGPVREDLKEPGIEVFSLDYGTTRHSTSEALKLSWNTAAADLLDRALEGWTSQDTVIHVHGWDRYLSSSVVRRAIDRGFPVVVTLHDYMIACPTGQFYNRRTEQICHLKPLSKACICTNCTRAKTYAAKGAQLYRHGQQMTRGGMPRLVKDFIVVSAFSEGILKPYLPESARVHHVPLGINVERRPKVDVASNNAFVFIGRLNTEKSPELFARAAAELGVEAIFVGDGPLRESVLNANPRAVVTGWVSPREVEEWLAKARCLVFTSTWYETFGLTPVEAQARGVPSIVSAGTATADTVVDEETGLLFKMGVQRDLVQKMRKMQDPEYAGKLGSQAYDRFWSDPLTPDRHIDGLMKIYQQLLTQKTKGESRTRKKVAPVA